MSEDDNHEEEPRRRHLLSSRSHSGQSIGSSDVPLLSSPLSGPVADDRERSINPHVLGPDVRTYGRASHGSGDERRLLNRLLRRRRKTERSTWKR